MRCLVIQTAFLGDVILTLPLVHLLRELEEVTWIGALVTPAGASFLESQDGLDEIFVYDKRGRDRGAAGLLRTARALRSHGIDTALIPHRSFRSALVPVLAGIGRRVGFDESGGRILLTDVVPYRVRGHEVERVASLLGPIGGAGLLGTVGGAGLLGTVDGAGPAGPVAGAAGPGTIPFSIRVPPDEFSAVDGILAGLGVQSGAGIVAVAPGSRWSTKRWCAPSFAGAADALSHEYGLAVVLTGGEDDAEAARAVADRMEEPPIDLTGRTTTASWIALIARARVLVSNDSAAAHVAAGVGTPVVAIFGPTVPEQGFAPYTGAARVVGAPVDCRPCGRHGGERCARGTMVCMTDVGIPDVLEAVRDLLKQPE